jgi:hypothetical protein
VPQASDSVLLDIVQRQTFRYFWHFAHPMSGLARERDNTVRAQYYWDYINEAYDSPNLSTATFGPEACAIGGTGMSIMATVVAVHRHWVSREAALRRLTKIVDFLLKADCYHGTYPHFMNGATGKIIAFDRLDDGADLVETSYLMMGLLTAKAYFGGTSLPERYFQKRVQQMWEAANWNWHTQGGQNKLFWHWSPNNGFQMNFPIGGYDEALITYIMAAASPTHPIARALYDSCWVDSKDWRNGKMYFGYRLPLDAYD